MEFCVGLLVLLIAVPFLFKLLGATLRALGPLIAVIVGVVVVVGVVALAVNLVGSLVNFAVTQLIGPLGLLLLGGAAVWFGYREWQKRQIGRSGGGSTHVWDAKPKRGSTHLEIGDDGEIVTLDELMSEDEPEKKKRE